MSKRSRKEVPQTEVALPVTPMLDMAFQLMFFFLATFNPSGAKEGQMDLSLPSKSEAAAKTPEQVNAKTETHKEDVDIPSDLTVAIRGLKDPRNKGLISAITVTTNAGNEELVGGPEQRERALRDKLKANKPAETTTADGKKRVPTVRMEAESDVRWAEVVKIMDICYRQGFQVSFAKPPDFGLTGQ